jgi:hypothetical protein
MDKPFSEVQAEIRKLLDEWHAEPFTSEEIERINKEMYERVKYRPHVKDWEKDDDSN